MPFAQSFAQSFFLMNHSIMPIPDLALWLDDTATLQEAHSYHGQNWPDWMPGPRRFREHASALIKGQEAAKNKDRQKVRELEEEHARALMSIHINANYIVMRSILENNDRLLHNVGYVLKEQGRKSYGVPQSLKLEPMVIKVKRGPEDGSIVVTFTRDPAAGLYHLQICKGEPTGEDSWGDYGLHKGCRVIVYGLDRASWYYARGRSQGDNETGPWSQPVGIIVT
jgi:hypothetical protein